MSTMNEHLAQGVDISAIARAVERVVPGATVLGLEPLGEGIQEILGSQRVAYGEPVLVRLQSREGVVQELMFTTKLGPMSSRANRAAVLLSSFDGAAAIPTHAEALDVGVISLDGAELSSLEQAGEFYLLSEFVAGHPYADELRAIATRGELFTDDLDRANELALALADLHVPTGTAEQYRASVRDAFGGEDGILGVIDGFASAEAPGAPRVILERLERLSLPWRWKLREYEHRCCRVHGDMNPFNAVFSDRGLRLMDARSAPGEAADDVVGLSLHYVFFGLLWPGTWKACFRRLWNAFWNTYLGETGDSQILEVAAPYVLLRALSLCSPLTYPGTPPAVRERLLGIAEQTLGEARFDPTIVESLFREEGPPSVR